MASFYNSFISESTLSKTKFSIALACSKLKKSLNKCIFWAHSWSRFYSWFPTALPVWVEAGLVLDSYLDFVLRPLLSRGKVIMKRGHCQQLYWIDKQQTEGSLCLKVTRPAELWSDDGVSGWHKYPWLDRATCVCVFASEETLPHQAGLQKSPTR